MMTTTTLIITTYNQPEYAKLCLEYAIAGRTRKYNNIILIKDGTEYEFDKSFNKYSEFDNVQLIDIGSKTSLQFILNYAASIADTDNLLIINDDNIMPSGWDLLFMSKCNRSIITFPQIELADSIFQFNIKKDFGSDYTTFDSVGYYKYIESTMQSSSDGMIQINGAVFPFLINRKDYLSVGGFDTMYDSPYVCDLDFFYKLQLNSFKFYQYNKALIYHFGSKSTKNHGDQNHVNKMIKSEQDAYNLFHQKWNFYPKRDNTLKIF